MKISYQLSVIGAVCALAVCVASCASKPAAEPAKVAPAPAAPVVRAAWDFADWGAVNPAFVEAKFTLDKDASFPSVPAGLNMIVKAGIEYNKYEASAKHVEFSGACFQGAGECMVISGVKGPFKVEVNYGSNGSSDKTDRSAFVKIAGQETKDKYYPTSVPVTGSTLKAEYNGTDTVDVIIGSVTDGPAPMAIRFYDVKILEK